MKHFHVHVAVSDLQTSIRFYSSLFASEPTVVKEDYAKWMLDDPRVNFAISRRERSTGINHLGFQVDSSEELKAIKIQLETADSLVEQTAAACCYVRSDKYWVTDPSGVAWEAFHTLGAVPVYGDATSRAKDSGACCVPLAAANDDQAPCCISAKSEGAQDACC